jgi:hypothetical protein
MKVLLCACLLLSVGSLIISGSGFLVIGEVVGLGQSKLITISISPDVSCDVPDAALYVRINLDSKGCDYYLGGKWYTTSTVPAGSAEGKSDAKRIFF